ncbi:anillin isoform X2 [Rhinoraja longicauda]
MDPFTEKLLERTRARRENLQKKMAERPTKTVGKRSREPLSEASNQPLEVTEEAKISTKPSPSKKRCSDKMETPIDEVENKVAQSPPVIDSVARSPPAINCVEQSTSLITSVAQPSTQPRRLIREQEDQKVIQDPTPPASLKNRMHRLAQQLHQWDSEGNEIDSPVSPVKSWKSVSPPPQQTETVQPDVHLTKVIPPTSKKVEAIKLPSTKGAQDQPLAAKVTISQRQIVFRDQPKKDSSVQVQPGGNLPTPGGPGVKSFLECFGERCQQHSVSSPAPSTPGQRTLNVTPSTKAIQERLFKQQEPSATAHLTQQFKQEREKELATIRNRIQRSNLWSVDKKRENCTSTLPEDSSEPLPKFTEQRSAEVHQTQMNTPQHALQSSEPNTMSPVKSALTRVHEPSSAKISSAESTVTSKGQHVRNITSNSAKLSPFKKLFAVSEQLDLTGGKGNAERNRVTSKELNVRKVASNPAKFSPFKRVSAVPEQLDVSICKTEKGDGGSSDKFEMVHEIEMSVDDDYDDDDEDEINCSAIIDELFDVLEEEEEEEKEEEEDDEMNEKMACTPMEETVDAVTNQKGNDKPSSSTKEGKCQLKSITRSESADNVGSSTDEHKLLYSIDAYRSQRIKNIERPSVKQVIVRKEDVSQRLEKINATPSSISIKQKMKNLNNEINIQQSVIHQASQALNCCTDEDHGKGSQQEAEAERLLLIASEKRLALLAEINKLKGEEVPVHKRGGHAAKSAGEFAPSRGCFALSDIRLPLKADFICSTAQKTDVTNYFFMLIKAGALNIVATPLASIQNALSGDAISFPTKFTLQDVSNDFEIEIEVYCMALHRESGIAEKKKKPNKSKFLCKTSAFHLGVFHYFRELICCLAITPKRLLTSITKTNLHTPALASPGGPNAVRTSNFSMVGSYKFALSSVGNSKFQLTKVPFLSPLEGHICVKLQCQVGSMIEERGFLTMFDDVSGFGAWHRRWCVLSGNCISYWTYPDDEKSKHPLGRINLANCTSRKIDPANREFCARPHTFELVTVRPQREDDRETLVSQCKNTLCVTKNWLSADTKDERNLWMQKLNRVLVDLRTWQPDACYSPHILLKQIGDHY